MPGRHAANVRRSTPFRKFVPLVSAIALAGVLIGGAAAAMDLGPAADSHAVADVAAPAAAQLTAVPSRTEDDRASRSGLRALPSPSAPATSASPSHSPSPSPSPKKPKPSPTQPSGDGTVSSSGTCGVSYYSDGTHTANGENFDPNAFTAASKTLPFNTRVRVTNPANGKSVVVRINDRGPYVSGRCLDLTRAAFAAIASLGSGVLPAAKWAVLS
ncbi:septal ring lytic transglycosylase RlpA family protein [Rugosimonospora africana]|uniref:septal ring lytic transglycosylase RlpA family protein n=1 Tax=Rugosimonospora africana TaxID=556532 RepID=UPI00194097EA|nr:septal ring lytic transglycosylase RlpA family protein [Rugosimonospora africana]